VRSLNPVTVRALERWLEVHPAAYPQNRLSVYEDGRQMQEFGLNQILYRFSANAKVPRRFRARPLCVYLRRARRLVNNPLPGVGRSPGLARESQGGLSSVRGGLP